MKLLPHGKNQTILKTDDGDEIFFSYQTPVAACLDGYFYCTNIFHSQTTSRHIANYIGNTKPIQKDQSFFAGLV